MSSSVDGGSEIFALLLVDNIGCRQQIKGDRSTDGRSRGRKGKKRSDACLRRLNGSKKVLDII
jgi:hypothetical protein